MQTFTGKRIIESGYHEKILPKEAAECVSKYITEYGKLRELLHTGSLITVHLI